MSNEQMSYFYNCCLAVEGQYIDYQSIAYARTMSDKEGMKKLNKSVDEMKTALIKDLIRK